MERLRISNSTFVDVGGNGVVISGYSRDSIVANCSFSRFGAAAMAVLGRTKLIDATQGDFPVNTTVAYNVAHDGGVYLKGYFGPLVLAKQKASHVKGNIFFNTPRAAITINDGALGGDVIESNLLFNANRETSDTGVIYTYDRLVFEFLNQANESTVVPAPRTIRHNMMLANYGCWWPIDHDDGSSYYHDEGNVLLYGGSKSFFGGHTKRTTDSLFMWPNLHGWGAAAMQYASVANASGYDEHWSNNTVVLGAGSSPRGDGYVDLQPCDLRDLDDPPVPMMSGNVVYSPAAKLTVRCGKSDVPFATWQASGEDVGTQVLHQIPSDEVLVDLARHLLRLDSGI